MKAWATARPHAITSETGTRRYVEVRDRVPQPTTATVRSSRKLARQNRRRGRS